MFEEANRMKMLESEQNSNPITNIKKEFEYVPRLFNFLQNNRHKLNQENQSLLVFDNKNLLQIIRQLAKELNQDQLEYDKIYVGNLCNFIQIIKNPRYSKFISLLKDKFYHNLPTILIDVFRFWRENQQLGRSQIAKAKLIAFLKILTQVHINKRKYIQKVFSPAMLCVISGIEPPNNEKMLKLLIKIIFQCQNIAYNQYKIKHAKILYESLKHSQFPVTELNRTLRFVSSQLTYHNLQGYKHKNILVQNLKTILVKNLRNINEVIDLKFLAIFINYITANTQQNKFSLAQFSQLCKIARNADGETNKIECLKQLMEDIKINKAEEKIDILMTFIPSTRSPEDCSLKLLPGVIQKLSSGCLIELANCQFTERICRIITNGEDKKQHRFNAVEVYKQLCLRMKQTNIIIHENMMGSMKYLQATFARINSDQVQQAFKFSDQ